ncbi:MAG TPA: PAS domain S-box protein, partial [Flavisolibacter sp.]
GMGYWYINLVTRKIVYSDSIYRLYGIKPQIMPGGINIFLNYVHLDDRDVVKEVTRKILAEHVPPDIDFRVIRTDGKVRYMRQKGRIGIYGEGEMVMMVTMQDITPEKTSERKLAELQQLVSTAEFARRNSEEMSEMGTWFMDLDSEEITWSDGLYTLLGLKTKATPLSLKGLLRYIHPDDAKTFRDQWKVAIAEGQDSKFEFRMVRNGQVLHICASFKIFNYGGKTLFIGTLQDLTKHQELKTELSQRLFMNNAVTDHIPERAFVTDEENIIHFWNRSAEQVYGIKREQALDKNYFDLFPELKTAEVLQFFQKVFNGETVWMPHTKTFGSNEFHDLLMVPLRSESGNITGIMHLLRDVTKEYETERQLIERAHFVDSIVEASVNRVIVMDRHMNYLYCNQKAADFYGLDREQIIGKNVLEVFPGSINDPTFDHFRKALKGETIRLPAIEGFVDEHNYEVHLLPIKDDQNFVTAVLWTHYDTKETATSRRES